MDGVLSEVTALVLSLATAHHRGKHCNDDVHLVLSSMKHSSLILLFRIFTAFGESMMEEGPIRLTKGWLGIKLAPGLEHCAILAGKAASDGNLDEEGPRRLFTFGDNAQGQLGRSASRNYITALKDIPIVDVASVGNRTYAVSDEGFLYCTGDFPKKISGNTKPQQVELGVGAHGKVKFDEIIVGKNANSLIAVQKTPNHDDLVFKLDLATHTLETVDWEGCRLVKVHETKVSGKYAVLKADFAAAED